MSWFPRLSDPLRVHHWCSSLIHPIHIHTLMVISPDADSIYLSSKSTALIPLPWMSWFPSNEWPLWECHWYNPPLLHPVHIHTFMVLSPDADTIYLSSKSTTLTAALCPTSTRLKLISVGDLISHTAMDRSCKTLTDVLKIQCCWHFFFHKGNN